MKVSKMILFSIVLYIYGHSNWLALWNRKCIQVIHFSVCVLFVIWSSGAGEENNLIQNADQPGKLHLSMVIGDK